MNFNSSMNHFDNKWIIFYSLLYFSLIISLVFGENSTGGAIKDYVNHKSISKDFSRDFYDTLFNYDKYNTRHSPVLTIFLSIFVALGSETAVTKG